MAKNTYSDWFNAIRNNNLSLVSSLKKIKVQIETVKALDEVEKTEAVELSDYAKGSRIVTKHVDDSKNQKGLYYSNVNETGKYFDAINQYSGVVVPLIDNLIASFNKEITDTNNYFGKRDNDTIESNLKITQIIIRHNQEILSHVQELSKYIPAIIELEEKALGQIDKGEEQLAEEFFIAFNNLTNSIDKKRGTENILEQFIRILFYLKNVMGTMKSLTSDYGGEFLKILKDNKGNLPNTKNAEDFADSALRNDFNINLAKVNDFLDKVGTSNGDNKIILFSNIKDDKVKSSISEFLNTALHNYYQNVNGYSDSFKQKINDAVPKKKGKFKEVEEIQFINSWNIASNLIMDENYVLGANKNIQIQGIGPLEYTFNNEENIQTTMTFDKFKTKYLKDEKEKLPILRDAIRVISNLNNKKSVQKFLENQILIQKSANKNGGFDGQDDKKLTNPEFTSLIGYFDEFLSFSEDSSKENIKEKWDQIYALIFTGAKFEDEIYYCDQFKIFANTIGYKVVDHIEVFNSIIEQAILLNNNLILRSAQSLIKDITKLFKNSNFFSSNGEEGMSGNLDPDL